ncbi:hypothetical protein M0802_007866 [Mischocyttarus mexicanus]|nr:hypothetical protein M0802_007866 [Mischocyttarus mexicanus]
MKDSKGEVVEEKEEASAASKRSEKFSRTTWGYEFEECSSGFLRFNRKSRSRVDNQFVHHYQHFPVSSCQSQKLVTRLEQEGIRNYLNALRCSAD